MSVDIDGFFDDTEPDGPPRDGYGRPKLFPRGADTSDEANRRPYTRASTLSDYLADFAHIWKWKMRYLARAIGQNSDLALMAGAECYTTGSDQGDLAVNRASGRRLDAIIDDALERGLITERANYGTAFHALTEPGNDGYVSDPFMGRDVTSYIELLDKLGAVILGTEMFTANDEWMVAGTFDNLMWVPGYGIIITDKKTSKSVHGEDFRIQLADYANSDLYDWETNERQTLEEYVESIGWDPALINRDVGLIMWTQSHSGHTEPILLDLVEGKVAGEHAVWVRDNHRKGKHQRNVLDEIVGSLAEGRALLLSQIGNAQEVDTLTWLWEQKDVQAIWTPDHTAAAVKRKEELS